MARPQTIHFEKKGAFINTDFAKVYLTQGMRGSGKSNLDEMIVEQLYLKGWTVLDLLGARNMENLYWAVNKNCREKYLERIRINPSLKGMMHCNCSRRYPISVVVPDYIKFDSHSIDMYNEKFWKKSELIEMMKQKGQRIDGILEYDRNHPPVKNSVKEWVKIKHLPPPTVSGSNKDLITDIFYDAVLEARRERRIIVMNPMLFPNEFHRYKTLELVIRSLEQLMYRNFKPTTPESVGKSRGLSFPVPEEGIPSMGIPKWTPIEKNWNKLCVLMREFGEVTANALKGENQSTLTKKALLQYIRQTRHYGISLVGDYQRPDDVFPSIREQADIFLIKRAPKKLLGDGWDWLFREIELRRKTIFKKHGMSQPIINYADKVFPRVEQLAKNYAYVVYPDNQFRLIKIPTPTFHHKQEDEHFENDTGIIWKESEHVNLQKAVGSSENKLAKDVETDETETKLFNVIERIIGNNKPNWDLVVTELTKLGNTGIIKVPATWQSKDAVRKWYKRKSTKQNKK